MEGGFTRKSKLRLSRSDRGMPPATRQLSQRQDAGQCGEAASGRSTLNVEPWPGLLATSMRPLCARITA
jgi:hypothetical protein